MTEDLEPLREFNCPKCDRKFEEKVTWLKDFDPVVEPPLTSLGDVSK